MNRLRERLWIVAIGAAMLAALASCRQAPPASAAAQTARQIAGEGGPLRVLMTVSPTTITTAGRVHVRLEMLAAPGVDAIESDLAKALPEGLSVAATTTDQRDSGGGSRTIIREFDVEPFLPGSFTIAAMEIAFKSQHAAPSNPIRTEPVKITVSSVLQTGEKNLADAKSIVEPPRAETPWLLLVLGASIAIAALGAVLWWRRRPVTPPERATIAAHDLALQRLSDLMSHKLVEMGRFKEFYEAASLILRRYIEDRFGLHAPERTTEEFLEESRASSFLMEDDVRALKKFLSHCDLVKFAAVIPSSREAEGVAASVREFVDRTKDAARVVEVEDA